jgi:hypothetical protein
VPLTVRAASTRKERDANETSKTRRRLRATSSPEHCLARSARWRVALDRAGRITPSKGRPLPSTLLPQKRRAVGSPSRGPAEHSVPSSIRRTEGWMLPPSSNTDQGTRFHVAPRRAALSRVPECFLPLGIARRADRSDTTRDRVPPLRRGPSLGRSRIANRVHQRLFQPPLDACA